MLSDFLPLLTAVLTAVGVISAGVVATRRLSKFGLTTEQLQVTNSLRQLLEVDKQKRLNLEIENESLKQHLADVRRSLDDCARQRDEAWSELRIRKRDDVGDQTRSNQRQARRDARDNDQ